MRYSTAGRIDFQAQQIAAHYNTMLDRYLSQDVNLSFGDVKNFRVDTTYYPAIRQAAEELGAMEQAMLIGYALRQPGLNTSQLTKVDIRLLNMAAPHVQAWLQAAGLLTEEDYQQAFKNIDIYGHTPDLPPMDNATAISQLYHNWFANTRGHAHEPIMRAPLLPAQHKVIKLGLERVKSLNWLGPTTGPNV